MATITRRGESWYLNWSQSGKQHRKSLGRISEREARFAQKAKEVELKSGRRILPTGLTFGRFKDDYLSWYATQYPSSYYRTEQIVTQHLSHFDDHSLDEIRIVNAELYTVKRLNHVKRGTVTKELRTLKAMLNKALDWELID